jgi:hypothetical protein
MVGVVALGVAAVAAVIHAAGIHTQGAHTAIRGTTLGVVAVTEIIYADIAVAVIHAAGIHTAVRGATVEVVAPTVIVEALALPTETPRTVLVVAEVVEITQSIKALHQYELHQSLRCLPETQSNLTLWELRWSETGWSSRGTGDSRAHWQKSKACPRTSLPRSSKIHC